MNFAQKSTDTTSLTRGRGVSSVTIRSRLGKLTWNCELGCSQWTIWLWKGKQMIVVSIEIYFDGTSRISELGGLDAQPWREPVWTNCVATRVKACSLFPSCR